MKVSDQSSVAPGIPSKSKADKPEPCPGKLDALEIRRRAASSAHSTCVTLQSKCVTISSAPRWCFSQLRHNDTEVRIHRDEEIVLEYPCHVEYPCHGRVTVIKYPCHVYSQCLSQSASVISSTVRGRGKNLEVLLIRMNQPAAAFEAACAHTAPMYPWSR